MDDLVEFLRARLDEDEAAALGAKGDTQGEWDDDGPPARDVVLYSASGKLTMGQHRHIARHDPARVLAEVEAKRRMLGHYESAVTALANAGPSGEVYDLMTGAVNMLRAVLLGFARVHVDHPDYKHDWALAT